MRMRRSRARAAEKETADDVAGRRKRKLEPLYGVLWHACFLWFTHQTAVHCPQVKLTGF